MDNEPALKGLQISTRSRDSKMGLEISFKSIPSLATSHGSTLLNGSDDDEE